MHTRPFDNYTLRSTQIKNVATYTDTFTHTYTVHQVLRPRHLTRGREGDRRQLEQRAGRRLEICVGTLCHVRGALAQRGH